MADVRMKKLKWPAEERLEHLVTGGVLVVPLVASFGDDGRVAVELTLDVANGLPVCTAYTVRRIDGAGGLEAMTTEVTRGINLRRLMVQALAAAAMEPDPEKEGVYRDTSSLAAIEAVIGPVQRRREPVTDARLSDFAESYRTGFEPGQAEQFAESVHMSVRTMYRWKRLAIERGLLQDYEEVS